MIENHSPEERIKKLKDTSEKITKKICEEGIYDIEIDCFLELLKIELGFIYGKKYETRPRSL